MTISPAIPSNGCNDFGPIDTRVGDQVNAEQAAASDAANASDRTHGVIWSAAAAIPCLGQPLESVQEMSDVVSSLASDVLVPSANLAQVLDPDKLRTGDAVDTAMLRDAQPQMANVAARSAEIENRSQPSIPVGRVRLPMRKPS